MENIKLKDGFNQVCVLQGIYLDATTPEEFEHHFLEAVGVRVQYLEEIITAPDRDDNGNIIPETGGRNDLLFAVHNDDVGVYALKRFEYADIARWIEDVYGNGGGYLYPERVAEYRCWV